MFGSWTTHQWGMFASVMMIGVGLLLAAGTIIYRRHVIAADMHLIHARWDAAQHGDSNKVRWLNGFAVTDVMPLYYTGVVVDPTAELLDVTEHIAPGPGSLASLREVGPGALTAAEPLVDDEVAAWFAAAFDPLLNEFRIAIEPAMRKAHLWELRGYSAGRGAAPSARAVLDHWRMDTPTGEWPLVPVTC